MLVILSIDLFKTKSNIFLTKADLKTSNVDISKEIYYWINQNYCSFDVRRYFLLSSILQKNKIMIKEVINH